MITSRTLAHTVLEIGTQENSKNKFDTLMTYLKENNLVGLLPQTLDHLKRLSKKTDEHDTVHVFTRYSLTEKQLAAIAKSINSGSSPMVQHIDEKIIGGFSATYKGNIYDGSLEHQVDKLSNMLTR